MTERMPGWPWPNALPARVSWYREALALQAPRSKPSRGNSHSSQDHDEVGRAEVDHASNSTPAGIRPTSIGDGESR